MFVEPELTDALLRGIILSIIALAWIVVLIRINGLRSLSKMTNYDFVMTVALGSLLAGGGQVSDWNTFWQVLAAMFGLFLAQFAASRLRKTSDTIEETIANAPCLLMRDGEVDQDALDENRVSKADLFAKLREANVLDFEKVRAVVLESTGDISVLHGDALDWTLLQGVKGAPDGDGSGDGAGDDAGNPEGSND